jgi:tryptophan synthase alpha chain
MLDFSPKPALIVYVTCGDPDLDTTREVVLAAIEAGAAIIELGVPFSDPVADGPVIQRASQRALARGTSLPQVLQLAAGLRKKLGNRHPTPGLIIFSYFNPILRMGLPEFCAAARHSGVDGALVVDLTVEEADDYIATMRQCDLASIFLAAPTSTDQRLKRIAQASRGFVYAVSRTGVTGAQQKIAADARRLVQRLRRFSDLPVAVGFGISNPEQFSAAGTFADGVVIGSAVVRLIEQNAPAGRAPQAVADFLRSLKRRAASGT